MAAPAANGGTGSSSSAPRGSSKTKNKHPRPREDLIQFALSATLPTAVFVNLLILFFRIKMTISPWTLDAAQKDDARGRYLTTSEVVSAAVVALLCWRLAMRVALLPWWRRMSTQTHSILLGGTIVFMTLVVTIATTTLRGRSCLGAWRRTDVGWMQVDNRHGLSLRTVCQGHVWEPWVGQAMDEYLYHQGNALDIGAFYGYHTLHMARHARKVFAVEGRNVVANQLEKHVLRNNAMNVDIVQSTIDKGWKPSQELHDKLWNEPLAFVKVDCEGCELPFLQGASDILAKWQPVMVLEIQDDASRSVGRLRGHVGVGQQMIAPVGSSSQVLQLLQEQLGYQVTPLRDARGQPTWDYLAVVAKP